MADDRTLKEKLLAWMRGDGGFGSFDEAAAEVFRFQYERNAPYRRYCERLGRVPDSVNGWRDIPALPTDAFKFPEFLPRSFPGDRTVKRFLTSGTTREVRGCHEFEDLSLYETSILEGWRQLGLPGIGEAWFLTPGPRQAPESSLSHMFGVLEKAAGGGRWMIDARGRIEAEGLGENGPVALFSTALGLLRFVEQEERAALPDGSWIFETGGYKGLRETLEPEAFRSRVAEHFGVPASKILNEYSMTELSSQFYRWPEEEAHRGPHWARVRVIDPETGAAAAPGEAGYLEIADLANLGSVAAVRTQDLAIARGDSAFTLLGRDPGALPRGCSRAADDLLGKR